MAPSTIKKAIGAVKDQTSIGIAKVAGNIAPDLEVLIVKVTSHDEDPPDERHLREILNLTSYSRGYVNACVVAIAKRLGKTRDSMVAIKALMLIHRLLSDGDPVFKDEIAYATRRGTRLLNTSDFRDEAHSNSWDYSGFVRAYGLYLDEKLEFIVYEKKLSPSGGDDRTRRDTYGEYRDEPLYGMPRGSRSYGDLNESAGREQKQVGTPIKDMNTERVLGKLNGFLRILDRLLACRPTGTAKNSRIVLVALYQIVKESFRLYADICEALAVLQDRFFEVEYADCAKVFDAHVESAKLIDELVRFYNWCKDTGVARSSEYPEVNRIADEILRSMDGFLKEKVKSSKSPQRKEEKPPAVEEREPDMNEIKALPPPENYSPPPPAPPPPSEPLPKPQLQQQTEDLVDLRDEAVPADDQGNKFALALFAGPPTSNNNGSWEAFPSKTESEVTSAWQTPAAERGKADWELALVETASHLSNQKNAMAGGFDPLLLNGMYDQGAVRQHVSTAQLTGGSASSVAMPGQGKSATPVLALPAPDGSIQVVGHQDPFAASLAVPPPSYVQIADMEKKQQLLMQEQQVWQQYGREGMQGQVGFAKIGGPQQMMMPQPYGMMPPGSGMVQPGGLGGYNTPY